MQLSSNADYNIFQMKLPKEINPVIKIGLALATLILFVFWLEHIPQGWMGELQAIGYSVCHQIPSHSFKIGSMTFPLCSRCMGMYLGVFIGMIVLLTKGKKSGFPSIKILMVFGILIIAWLVDGINSFLYGVLGKIPIYIPNNTLRLITGLGMGLCISAVLYILFNLTVWQNFSKKSPIDGKTVLFMGTGAILIIFLIYLNNEILMTLFAYISTITIMALLTTLYTIVWIILLHKENSFREFKELLLMINAGLFCALLQVILLDAFRLALTGTWASLVS
jgi:uncharacterized membrane protein